MLSLSWENKDGYLACGGSNKYLKMLRFEVQRDQTDDSARGIAAQLNLTTNQSLIGHSDNVFMVRWNRIHNKVATVDSTGSAIIWVWDPAKSMWVEDLVNKQKQYVKDLQWSPNGERITVVYVNRMVIMGSVDGDRLWGKELNFNMECVQWSPDSKLLLMIASETGQMHFYDANGGNFLFRISDFGSQMKFGDKTPFSKAEWYTIDAPIQQERQILQAYYGDEDAFRLALLHAPDKIILVRNERDKKPLTLSCSMRITCFKWNTAGTVLAISGSATTDEGEECAILTMYDCYGEHMRTLKIPGKKVISLSWEYSDIRLAMSVDTYIYIINCRPSYNYAFLKDSNSEGKGTLAYYKRSKHSSTDQSSIIFWDLQTGAINKKQVGRLLCMNSVDDRCLLVSKDFALVDATNTSHSEQQLATASKKKDFRDITVSICDSMGATIKSKQIEYEPKLGCITPNTVVLVNSDGYHVHLWNYQAYSSGKRSTTNLISDVIEAMKTKESVFHVDLLRIGNVAPQFTWPPQSTAETSGNPITAITAKNNCLLIARSDGTIHQLSCRDLFHIVDHIQFCSAGFPSVQYLQVNCDESLFSVTDITGVTRFANMNSLVVGSNAVESRDTRSKRSSFASSFPRTTGTNSKTEKELTTVQLKDSWNLIWARDDPFRLAVLEKTKLFVYKHGEPEEPLTSSGYLCDYSALTVTTALMDELQTLDQPHMDLIVEIDCAMLRQVKAHISNSRLQEAFALAEEKLHPKLWKLVGYSSINSFQLDIAMKSFVQSQDYPAIKFVQRLLSLEDKRKRQAEVYVWLTKFDEAEQIYLEMDRRDLALEMWMMLGRYDRALKIVGSSPSKLLLDQIKRELCSYYFERQQWDGAAKYFCTTPDFVQLCLIREDYDALERCADELPPSDKLLETIGDSFRSVGMCKQSCKSYLKLGKAQKALDACVFLREWGEARQLAAKFNLSAQGFIDEYARSLSDSGQHMALIELHFDAGNFERAADMIHDIAMQMWTMQKPTLSKRCFVLRALALDKLHKSTGTSTSSTNTTTVGGIINEAWREVKCIHYFLLAQSLYHRKLFVQALNAITKALKSAIITREQLFGTLALIAFRCMSIRHLSVAISQLVDEVETDSDYLMRKFDNDYLLPLYMQISAASKNTASETISSSSDIDPEDLKVCVSTGRIISETGGVILVDGKQSQLHRCDICNMMTSTPNEYHNCPVCHSPF